MMRGQLWGLGGAGGGASGGLWGQWELTLLPWGSLSSVLPESGIVADIEWEPPGGGTPGDTPSDPPGDPPGDAPGTPADTPGTFYCLKSQPLPQRYL